MRSRRAQRLLQAAGVIRRVPQPQPGVPGQPPNRIAYWVAAQVLLPSGALALVTDEVISARPIHTADQLREIERQIGESFSRQTQAGLPVVGGRGPEAHVMSFQVLRAWYEPAAVDQAGPRA